MSDGQQWRNPKNFFYLNHFFALFFRIPWGCFVNQT